MVFSCMKLPSLIFHQSHMETFKRHQSLDSPSCFIILTSFYWIFGRLSIISIDSFSWYFVSSVLLWFLTMNSLQDFFLWNVWDLSLRFYVFFFFPKKDLPFLFSGTKGQFLASLTVGHNTTQKPTCS